MQSEILNCFDVNVPACFFFLFFFFSNLSLVFLPHVVQNNQREGTPLLGTLKFCVGHLPKNHLTKKTVIEPRLKVTHFGS